MAAIGSVSGIKAETFSDQIDDSSDYRAVKHGSISSNDRPRIVDDELRDSRVIVVVE